MTEMRYEEISAEADRILNNHGRGIYPVPVVEIANKLGITVYSDHAYAAGRSGHIEIDDTGTTSIVVNESDSPTRMRFTIAHEIAHHLFDLDYLQEHRTIDRNGNAADATYRDRERRANYFAANLLMPKEAFIEQWLALDSLEKVAEYFSVSREAAKFRALALGLTSGY